ncbi:MAG: hypothetical protein CVT92_16505 [Bacteroidetes bacterium HGW-Bacteroidetes-1]|jgi:hypothetical protein|nr:MAG: hypothetical protein CVT92_16505 [Bacteroidetes bacterium HGW-Bacteroidetes-1]
MKKLKSLLGDIRFWIVLFFFIRLIGITQPPLEVAHNWRQTTVTMVARNFYETDANPFYPRIDIVGEKSGITGMEFPLLNYLIYLASLLFGYDHWYGRLINLMVSSAGIWFFYMLGKKYFGKQTAFNAALILLSSLWFMYSRKIMPDTFSVSLVLAGLYFGVSYLEKDRKFQFLIGFFVLITAGLLSKFPSVMILSVIPLIVFSKKYSCFSRRNFFIALILGMLPSFFWYFYWAPYLVQMYGFHHFFMGKGWLEGLSEISLKLPETGMMFVETSIKYFGFAAFLAGIISAIIKKQRLLLMIFGLSSTAVILYILKSGDNFPRHSYYMIPYIPVMALVAGYALNLIRNKVLLIAVLSLIVAEGLLNQQHDFRIREIDKPIVELGNLLDNFSKETDLILINSGEYPTPMYFAHRKGWVSSNSNVGDTSFINSLRPLGLRYILILKRSFGTNQILEYECLYDSENFSIYKP